MNRGSIPGIAVLYSPVVRISGFHSEDPGSIPGIGIILLIQVCWPVGMGISLKS